MTDRIKDISLSPLKITLGYIVIGGAWIILTEFGLSYFISNPDYLSTLKSYSSWIYILLTAPALFFFLNIFRNQYSYTSSISSDDEVQQEPKEEEARGTKKLLVNVFQSLNESVIVQDAQNQTIINCNKASEKIFGYSREELLNSTAKKLYINERKYKEFREQALTAIEETDVFHTEFKMQKKSGKQFYSDHTVTVIHNEHGDVDKFVSVIRDITEKRKDKRELERVQYETKIGYWEFSLNDKKPPVWSDNLYNIYGLDPDEYSPTTESFLQMLHPQDYYLFDELKKRIIQEGSFEENFRLIKPNGEIGYYYGKNELITDDEGNPQRILGIIQDISDLKQTEEELRKEQQRFKLVAETTGDVIWDLDINNKKLWWSKGFEEIFGYAREEPKSNFNSWSDYVHPDDEAKVIQSSQEQLNSNSEHWEQEYRIIRKDGSIAHIVDRAAIVRNSEGKAIRMVGITDDITDRKEAEKRLLESEEKYRQLFENNPEPMCIYNPNTLEFVEVNQAAVELYGYSREEFNHMKVSNIFLPEDIPELKRQVQEHRGKTVHGNEWTHLKKDGSHINIVISGTDVLYQGQSFRMIFANEITAQKKLRQQIQQSEEKYRHLFENNPEPMWIYNPDTLKFIEINQAAIEHYGYTEKEFLNMTLADIRPPEDIDAMKQDVQRHRGQNSYSEEWTHLTSDGTEIDVKVSAADVKYKEESLRLVLINDVTEQKRVQEKMIQSVIEGENRERERIAHELHDGLGQYLVAANMNFESVKNNLGQLEHKQQNQFKIGISLLKNALSETRSISYNLMPKAIADFGLAKALENMVQDFRKSTDIEFQFDHNCDGLRLEDQAEINIYRIFQEITSNSVRHADCTKIGMKLQLKEDSLNIMVSDNGVGTKLSEQQKGSGLGLQGIKMRVNNLEGSISIDTEPGEGMKTVINIPNIRHLITNGETHD